MRLPSVTRFSFCKPSLVICLELRIRGKGIGERSQKNPPARTRRENRETTIHLAERLCNAAAEADTGTTGAAASTLPELVSRLRRFDVPNLLSTAGCGSPIN